jgi:ATP dependent DNA ligase domain
VAVVVPLDWANFEPATVFGSKDQGFSGSIHGFHGRIAVLADALALLDACAGAMDDVSFLIAPSVGYLCRREISPHEDAGRTPQLWSRNQKNLARRFPTVVRALTALPDDTVIDGEVVALDERGHPSFDLLQGLGTGEPLIVLYAFDLLMLGGRDVRGWPLEERRGQLSEAIKQLPDTVRYSETFSVPLAALERAVREHQLEGIVAKRAGSPYRSGERCGDWLKWRANRGQEFVIAGYIPNGAMVDSLLVGYYEGRYLMYAGSVRAGLPIEFRRVLVPHLEQLQIAQCPFVNVPDRTEGRWGEGLTAAKMVACCWLPPGRPHRVFGMDPSGTFTPPSFRWNPYRQRGS